MRILPSIITTTWRLAWRRPSFWVVQVILLLAAGLFLFAAGATDITGLAYVSNQIFLTIALLILLLPLITLPAVLRDQGSAGDVLWTTPVDAVAHHLGTILGLWLALLPLLALQVAVRWAVGLTLPGVNPHPLWLYGLPLLLLATLVGLGLAVLLATFLRHPLPVLLLWVPLWILPLAPVYGFLGPNALMLRYPLNLYFYGLELSPSLGLGPAAPLVLGLMLWFFGLGLLLVLLALATSLLLDARRATRQPLPLALFTLLAIAFTAGGYLAHRSALAAQAPVTSPSNVQLDRWTVLEHNLEAVVLGEQIEGRSFLRLEAGEALSELVLRLNPGLEVVAAQDEVGQALAVRRQGDSILLELLSPSSTAAMTLHWHGILSLPYSDYGHRLVVTPVPTMTTPQRVRALLTDSVGYLLRDGDWYPWPWSTLPHQAESSEVRVWTTHAGALASTPMKKDMTTWSWRAEEPALLRGNVATWRGELPPVLLVLPPSQTHAFCSAQLHYGARAGMGLVEGLERFAAAAPVLWAAMGETPPRHIVALPYLKDFMWSGDLLLVPEGTGVTDFLQRDHVEIAYRRGPDADIDMRVALMSLARAWLAHHAPLPKELARGYANPEGLPIKGEGRWVEALDLGRIIIPEGPRVIEQRMTPTNQFGAVALWLALELAPETVRAEDLTLIRKASTRPVRFHDRLLPAGLGYGEHVDMTNFVVMLADWAEEVGRAFLLELVAETIREQETFDFDGLMERLEQKSGIALAIEGGAREDSH